MSFTDSVRILDAEIQDLRERIWKLEELVAELLKHQHYEITYFTDGTEKDSHRLTTRPCGLGSEAEAFKR